jgi:hypothetical protein
MKSASDDTAIVMDKAISAYLEFIFASHSADDLSLSHIAVFSCSYPKPAKDISQ